MKFFSGLTQQSKKIEYNKTDGQDVDATFILEAFKPYTFNLSAVNEQGRSEPYVKKLTTREAGRCNDN